MTRPNMILNWLTSWVILELLQSFVFLGNKRFINQVDSVALSLTLLQNNLRSQVSIGIWINFLLTGSLYLTTIADSYDARLVDIWACGIIYYCLHFQELPWGSAQMSDRTYAQYAQQCSTPQLSIANVPFLKNATSGLTSPVTPGPSTPHRQDSNSTTPTLGSIGSPTTPSYTRSRHEEKELAKEQTAPYPSTIRNLSPRACRPVLRRMLEPKPELRVTIEDILRHPWVAQIEVCVDPGVVPKHIHPAPIAAAAAGGIVNDK
ncbi:serine/threonine-protein kinase HAL4/sat4 [Serendipita sp. 398]|nr:serine/threonine-protein kinase HAL4/sat4 [Serendipita sp. 398]